MVKLECDAGSPGLRAPVEIRFEGASMGGHRLVDVARLVQSHQRADSSTLKFFSLLLAALFAFVILNDNALHIRHVSMEAVELIVACVFAFSVLLRSFLVYYYDRVE